MAHYNAEATTSSTVSGMHRNTESTPVIALVPLPRQHGEALPDPVSPTVLSPRDTRLDQVAEVLTADAISLYAEIGRSAAAGTHNDLRRVTRALLDLFTDKDDIHNSVGTKVVAALFTKLTAPVRHDIDQLPRLIDSFTQRALQETIPDLSTNMSQWDAWSNHKRLVAVMVEQQVLLIPDGVDEYKPPDEPYVTV